MENIQCLCLGLQDDAVKGPPIAVRQLYNRSLDGMEPDD